MTFCHFDLMALFLTFQIKCLSYWPNGCLFQFRYDCRPELIGNFALSNNNGDGYKNVTQKVKSRCLKLYRAHSISFNSSYASNISRDCIEVQEKKKKVVVLCSCPQQNVKLGNFTSLSCSDGQEMYKKVVVLLILTYSFLAVFVAVAIVVALSSPMTPSQRLNDCLSYWPMYDYK